MSLKRYYSETNYSSKEVDVLPRPLSKRIRRLGLGTVSNPIDLTLEEREPTLHERLQAVEEGLNWEEETVDLDPVDLDPADVEEPVFGDEDFVQIVTIYRNDVAVCKYSEYSEGESGFFIKWHVY